MAGVACSNSVRCGSWPNVSQSPGRVARTWRPSAETSSRESLVLQAIESPRGDHLKSRIDGTRRNKFGALPLEEAVASHHAPLILAAWWEASDNEKKERLKLHIRWANNHGALAAIDKFLRSLPESDWHHE